MSYTPTNWVNGDVITAEKLNKIEEGITEVDNNLLFCYVINETGNLDKTWQEIYDALEQGKIVNVVWKMNDTNLLQFHIDRTKFENNLYWIGYGVGENSQVRASYPWCVENKTDLLWAYDW